jgi:AmpE protein
MNLLAVLAALAAEQFAGNWRDDTRPGVLEPLYRFARFRSGAVAVVVVVTLSTLVGYGVSAIHDPLIASAVSAVILFLCLGPRDIASDVNQLLAARANGEVAAAERVVRALRRGPEPDADHRSLLGALFIQSHERVFGVLLWFVVCGPGGALAYRLASRLPLLAEPDSPALPAVETLHAALAWIPARATALLYALAGSMDHAGAAWRQLRLEPQGDWRQYTWTLLAETATGALAIDAHDGPVAPQSLDACFREILRMQNRALLILLAAVVLRTASATFA